MAVPACDTPWVARFGVFEADLRAGELRRNGLKVKLQQQPFQILAMLLERPGEIVTREELRARLWSADIFVDFDHGLNSAIRRLRDALGDSAENPTFVETLGGRGYRFVFPVEYVNGFNGNSASPVAVPNPVPEPRPAPSQPHSAQRRWKLKAAVVLAVCFVIAGLLYPWIRSSRERSLRLAELQHLTVAPLTTLPGHASSPTFSPDGSQVAFAWDGEGNGKGYDLYVKVMGSEKPLRLTYHPSAKLSVDWSPDGRNIAVSRGAGEDDSGIFLVPPTGGPERKIATRSPVSWYGIEVGWISWSADGKRLAFVDHPANAAADATLQLYLLSLDTLERTKVDTGCSSVSTPAFSPRGKFLAWVCNKAAISSSLWLMRLKDGERTQLLSWENGISGLAWSSDERRIAFSSWFNDGAIWETSLAHPTFIQRLPVGHDASDLAANPAGPGLAYKHGSSNVNIWRLDLLTSPPQARKLVTSSRQQRAPSISPDGSKIAFESTRSGGSEVWVCDADGSNAQQLTHFGQSTTGTPRWSPDGKLIAFDSRMGGEANIYLVDAHGGVPHKLSIDLRDNSMASWSHDGQWIYFVNGEDTGKPTVWKVPSGGGHAVPIANRSGTFPIESPNEEYIYFARNKKLWQAKTDGSMEQQVAGMPDLDFLGDEWFPSEAGIYFLAHEGDKTVINLFDFQSKQARPIFALAKSSPPWIGGMPVSNDGKWLLYPQVDESTSNLMIIENWQ